MNTLTAVGLVFLAAGLTARAGRRIGLPTIPLFMAAGMVFGPNTPGVVLVDHPEDLELLAALGLVLLLFHLGLEFSLDDLLRGGRRLVVAGTVYLALNVTGGLVFGWLLGWGTAEALVLGGVIGISSSAIVTKLLVELKRLTNEETRVILGVIVVEDLFLAVYLAVLQPALGGAAGLAEVAGEAGRAILFLVVLLAVARWGARAVGRLLDTGDDELLTVLFVGLALLVAGLAEEVGAADAIGAFMAGLIVAETAVASRVERLVLPLRDAFAAVFFFAFGLSIDPGAVGDVAGLVAAAVALTLVLNLVAGLLVGRLQDLDRRGTANLATTIVARGEFALILAALAAAAGLDDRLGPLVAGYVLVLAIGGPILAARSAVVARWLPARLFPVKELVS